MFTVKPPVSPVLEFGIWVWGLGFGIYLPLVSREWKNGSNSRYNCTPFLYSLLTKGKSRLRRVRVWGLGLRALVLGFRRAWGFGVGV